MNVDSNILAKITKEKYTLADMTRLLRRLWILDMGSVFEDNDTPAQLWLNTGVWEENKKVLGAMKKNRLWWKTYYSCVSQEGTYVFVGD